MKNPGICAGAFEARAARALVVAWSLFLACVPTAPSGAAQEGSSLPMKKTASVLYPARMVDKAKGNAAAYPWADAMRREIIEGAALWLNTEAASYRPAADMTDDALWDLMFGATISRSWMVWSDGFCPACKKGVRMYAWEMDPWTIPEAASSVQPPTWKTRCPHCKELFPKNDFPAFYQSGLDEHGVFQPTRADRSLLFNTGHPDPNDPLHTFGVDDGEGYVDAEGHRWRFIGAYLIYGQWKKWIVDGVTHLSDAYMVTGDPLYARKTAILLDRIADLFPTFDFGSQGFVYEGRTGGPLRGQVSTWHDACEEARQLALGYDRIFEAAKAQEEGLAAFLSEKASRYKLDNAKRTWADIQRNIEERIFRDTLVHRERIESNYPTTDRTILTMKTVLDWPGNRDEVMTLLDELLTRSTAVDGVSGEKGLAGYTTIAPRSVAVMLGEFSRLEPGLLRAVYERHPRLHACYRFHVDTWCMEKYYPHSGDSGGFGTQVPGYAGVGFSRNPGTSPSMYTFPWNLYELTQDPVFVQALYHANDHKADELPHDIFADDPQAFQAQVKRVIDKVGAAIEPPSVNKQEWRIALLRSGTGENQRALWIDYDSGERHSHADGMNIGLFAKGLDLIPEFGYPPVGYGGWESQKARWYTKTAAHVTVAVDGKDQNRVNTGVTTLWADGKRFHAIRCSDPAMINGAPRGDPGAAEGKRYERAVALVDLNDRDSYVIDAFIVSGGKDHAKFFHSFFGPIETEGLALENAENYGHETEMQHFRRDPKPAPGWSVDWTIEDRYKYLSEPKDIHLRYTDLTFGATAYLAEAWVDVEEFGGSGGTYIPCVMTRRTSPDNAPLTSAFAAVIEPYENESNLAAIHRLALKGPDGEPAPETALGIEVVQRDNRRDLFIMPDATISNEAADPESQFRVRGSLGFVTLGPDGPERIVLCQGTQVTVGDIVLRTKQATQFIEVIVEQPKARVVSGNPDDIESLTRGTEKIQIVSD